MGLCSFGTRYFCRKFLFQFKKFHKFFIYRRDSNFKGYLEFFHFGNY